jgi:hypothetical protein
MDGVSKAILSIESPESHTSAPLSASQIEKERPP